jgi:exodeoxyribonuclease V alpha subunit
VELVAPKTKGVKGLEALLRDRVTAAWGDLATLEPAEGLVSVKSLRILCAHHHGMRGVTRVNLAVQQWLVEDGHIAARGLWYEGRPLLVGRNDSAMDLRNGNVGIIRHGKAWFDLGGLREIPPSLLPEHKTLYATTVHKADLSWR